MLADYLTAWMSDLLSDLHCTYWITDWLSYCLNEWPADLLTIWLNDWLWLNFWLTTDLLTFRYMYTTSLIDWLSNLLANWLTDYNNWLTWWLTDSLTNKINVTLKRISSHLQKSTLLISAMMCVHPIPLSYKFTSKVSLLYDR